MLINAYEWLSMVIMVIIHELVHHSWRLLPVAYHHRDGVYEWWVLLLHDESPNATFDGDFMDMEVHGIYTLEENSPDMLEKNMF